MGYTALRSIMSDIRYCMMCHKSFLPDVMFNEDINPDWRYLCSACAGKDTSDIVILPNEHDRLMEDPR